MLARRRQDEGGGSRRTSSLAGGAVALALAGLGSLVIAYNAVTWQSNESFFAYGRDPANFVLLFYTAEGIALFVLLLSFYQGYRFLRSRAEAADPRSSLLSILGSEVSGRRLWRVAAVSTALYGLLYALASSILVVQTSVDFASVYGVTSPSWSYVSCCGDPGTVPKLILYVDPSWHVAVELVPLSLLLLFVVPPLVGWNVAIALSSVQRTVARMRGRWMVASGAVVGLFTACPTCAGLFLAESVGGIGATAVAVTLASYQTLFIMVSIPLLVFTPFFFAARVRRGYRYEDACEIPGRRKEENRGTGSTVPGNVK